MEFMPGLHPWGMKQIKQISIANPCTQNWDKMQPDHSGKFCGSCQKTVVDFTQLSNPEILQVLSSSQKVCGRSTHVQLMVLNQEIVPQQRSSLFSWNKLSLAAAFMAALPFVHVQAQVKPVVEQHPVILGKVLVAKDSVVTYKTITGCITSKDDKGTLPGATIKIKGTSLTCSSKVDGTFSIQVPANKKLTLVVMYVGFKTQEIKFDPDQKTDFNIQLESTGITMGEVVITHY